MYRSTVTPVAIRTASDWLTLGEAQCLCSYGHHICSAFLLDTLWRIDAYITTWMELFMCGVIYVEREAEEGDMRRS